MRCLWLFGLFSCWIYTNIYVSYLRAPSFLLLPLILKFVQFFWSCFSFSFLDTKNFTSGTTLLVFPHTQINNKMFHIHNSNKWNETNEKVKTKSGRTDTKVGHWKPWYRRWATKLGISNPMLVLLRASKLQMNENNFISPLTHLITRPSVEKSLS